MLLALALALVSLSAPNVPPDPDPPASHLWIINEVFSNDDGTIQFIEMKECCGSSLETQLAGKSVYSDATGHTFTFPSNLVGNTAHRYLLLGTAQYAALPGAPPPDQILPANFFAINGDTIRWHIYPNATLAFGAGALPIDGFHSLNHNGTTGVNSPTNWPGQSGTINASTAIPALPLGWMAALIGGAVVAAALVLRRRPALARA